MPFEMVAMIILYNAIATFYLRAMNEVLRKFLHKFVIVYLDDECIYNRTLDEHMEHLRLLLMRFHEDEMFPWNARDGVPWLH
jgi:hypothetical protein